MSGGLRAEVCVTLSALMLGLLMTGCGSEEARFEAEIIPILETRCADARCHGSVVGNPLGHRLSPRKWLTFRTDEAGRIVDIPGALVSVKAKINSRQKPVFSTFLRKTLPTNQGGQFHFMGSAFQSREAADYQKLARWVARVNDGTEGVKEPAFTPNERLFAETVYPLLIDRGCAAATCHGTLAFGGGLIHPPPRGDLRTLSRKEMRQTYVEMQRNITAWGDRRRSRLIAKVVPLEFGGIAHKGGNDVFFAGDLGAGADPRDGAAMAALLAWISAEREQALGKMAPQPPLGAPGTTQFPTLVAVGGPLVAAGPFEVQAFTPGTDLYRLTPVKSGVQGALLTPSNLTAQHHQQPVDIRDPAISHDGTRLVFSMRTSAVDAHNIYTMNLDGSNLRQLTFDSSRAANGLMIGNFGPIFGPNGGFVDKQGVAPKERIYFSSTRAADHADVVYVQNADLYVMDVDSKNLERLTYTITPEVDPNFLVSGEFSGTMAYTIKRSIDGGYKGVIFRFPICHNRAYHLQPEAHPHFGISEPEQVFYGLRELPDGRSTVSLLDENNVWRGGQLATLERQFSAELPESLAKKATLPNFRHALNVLTPTAARTGLSADGLWRDARPLPDGSVVVAHAQGPLDLSDRKLTPRTRLLRLTLVDNRDTGRTAIGQTDVLLDTPKMAWSQPAVVLLRPTEDPPHKRIWNHREATATLLHNGVRVIEALVAQLPPSKARALRKNIAYVRVVAPVSILGAVDVTPVPAAQTRHAMPHATRSSLTGTMPLFAAMEVPPASDGSLAAKIPARVSLRIVTLDEDRIAVGALQHHWYAAMPGELFPVGIPVSSYGVRCAGCHGAMNGQPNAVLQSPTDFITQASITAARYIASDRRRPKVLPTIDSSFFISVDFRRDIQPILTKKCATAGCHLSAKSNIPPQTPPAGKLSLTAAQTEHYTDAYESLLAPGSGSMGGFRYVDARSHRARRSFLTEKVMQREYDAPRQMKVACPPANSPQLTAQERRLINRWIELGAAFVGIPSEVKKP